VRDPWLPPVIRIFSTSPGALDGIRKNSSRTGRPVVSVRPGGKNRLVSEKLISALDTNRAITRLVNPGIAFGSITTTGLRRSSAAITGGPATYPPILNTAETAPRSYMQPSVTNGSRAIVAIFCAAPTRFNPPISIVLKSNPSAGTKRDSIPLVVPMKYTLCPRCRSSRATASAGMT
jgi:hypothetical protein